MIRHAMLLAAGLGSRMRPLTAATAKPLLPLGGRSLLDHALDRLVGAGIEQVVINTHWQAELVAQHLAGRSVPRILLRREAELLDTGGAVAAALADGDLPDQDPFFTINGDSFWVDGPTSALSRLSGSFDPDATDAVLLVHRSFQVQADVGCGDFMVDPWGGMRRRTGREVAPYVFAGVQVASARLFAGLPPGRFSMNIPWDRALSSNRLRAVVHDGLWFHLSQPRDLSEAESALQASEPSETT